MNSLTYAPMTDSEKVQLALTLAKENDDELFNLMMGNIKEEVFPCQNNGLDVDIFNKTLGKETRYKAVSFDEFKRLNSGKYAYKMYVFSDGSSACAPIESTDAQICKFENVQVLPDRVEFDYPFSNEKKHFVIFYEHKINDIKDGSYGSKFDSKRLRVTFPYEGFNKIEFCTCTAHRSFSYEKVIAICWMIHMNKLPDTFQGIEINVLDGSAVFKTATYLNKHTIDLSPSNLELTTSVRNKRHGKKIKNLFNLLDIGLRYSANDDRFLELLEKKGFDKRLPFADLDELKNNNDFMQIVKKRTW